MSGFLHSFFDFLELSLDFTHLHLVHFWFFLVLNKIDIKNWDLFLIDLLIFINGLMMWQMLFGFPTYKKNCHFSL